MPPGPRNPLFLIAALLPLAACNVDKQPTQGGDERIITPGGTDQAATVNATTGGNSSDAMPTVGAPGTGGAGTQPDNAAAQP